MTRRAFAVLLIVCATFAGDRVTKLFFFNEPTHRILPGIIETTRHRNFGLVANLPVPSWIIISLTMIVLAGIGWKLIDGLRRQAIYDLRATSYALSLITGGALGNLFDRLTMGYVFDWIWILHRSVINVADIAIGAGIVWWIIESKNGLRPHFTTPP